MLQKCQKCDKRLERVAKRVRCKKANKKWGKIKNRDNNINLENLGLSFLLL